MYAIPLFKSESNIGKCKVWLCFKIHAKKCFYDTFFPAFSLFQFGLEHINGYTELIQTQLQGHSNDFIIRSIAEMLLD